MSFIYLASPYSTQDYAILVERFRAAEATVAFYLQRGITLYSPIVAHHALAKRFNLPKDADWWMEHNKAMLERAESLYVLMIPGWQQSKGVTLEREFALDHRIPEYMVTVSESPPCPPSE